MIAEAMQKVQDLVERYRVPATVPWDPRKDMMFLDANGVLETRLAIFGPARVHKVSSLPSFGEYVSRWQNDAKKPNGKQERPQSVWFNRKAVVFFPDDIRREDKISIDLEPSPQMAKLEAIDPNNGKLFDSRAFWRFLRIDMDKCVDRGPELIAAIQGVKWKKEQEQGATVTRGKSSLGSEIRSQIEGLSEIPERVTFRIPAFKRHVNVTVTVECAIELDENNCGFNLIPFPGEIERAWSDAEYSLFLTLVGQDKQSGVLPDKFPVFYGTP